MEPASPEVERERRSDGHVHLKVASTDASTKSSGLARAGVALTAAASVGLFAWSFFLPWWSFQLYAPQYPKGLKLVISLTGVTGDVSEIDILNHYIGMHSMANAAPTERALAGWGVAAVCVMVVGLSLAAGRKLNRLVAAPAVAFPLVFVADCFYWLYKFGHELDPKAPLKIGVFTPELFGNGQIGQFGTFAQPALGFWIALGGAVLAIVGTVLRARVCASCGRASRCSVGCSRLMLLPDRKAET